jgi:hypothetical protein
MRRVKILINIYLKIRHEFLIEIRKRTFLFRRNYVTMIFFLKRIGEIKFNEGMK